MAQGSDSTGTNNLTGLVTLCACVLYHKAHIRNLNWGASASCLIADKTCFSSQLVKKSWH